MHIHRILATAERRLNKVDYVPILSSYSGALRIVAGAVQIAAGAAFVALKAMHAILADSGDIFLESWEGVAQWGYGLGNITRGFVAIFPGVNLLLIFHDYQIGRMNYRFEPLDGTFYPLNQEHLWKKLESLCEEEYELG